MGVTNPTMAPLEHSSSASPEEGSDDMDFSAPKTCATRSSPTNGTTLDACAGSVLTPHDYTPMFRKDSATESGWEVASADPSVPSWNNSWNTQKTCSNAAATREHHSFVHAVVYGMKLADPGITLLRNPGRLIFSPPLLSPDAVRPWACVWPSPLQRQLAEMLPQAAFDPKLSNNRNEIVELRQQGIHYRPLVWTADGRPHPAVTRTLQLSAKSRPRRWKHEIQIALLRLSFSGVSQRSRTPQHSRSQQRQVRAPPARPRRYCRLVPPLCALLSANAGPDPQVVV